MNTSKSIKATSYKDLLKNFQQAESPIPPPREKTSTPRPLMLKKSTARENKQNIVNKSHIHSQAQKSQNQSQNHQFSQWIEEDILKQYNHQRKDRQLKLSYNKFIANITNILSKLTNAVPPDLLVMKLTYLQYLAALEELPSPNDNVTQLWNQLCANGQTAGIFIIIVAAILKMRRPQDQQTEKTQHFWKKYSDLRYTRMEQTGKVKTFAENEQQFPFTPIISQRSRTLAASRSKSKDQKDKCFTQKNYNQHFQQSSGSKPQSAQSKELLDSKTGNRRSQILYKMAKQKSLQKKRDKKSSQVQYQKSINQLTFHPKIQPIQKDKSKKNLIQGEQDSINRMIRGRIQREVRRVINEKGLPYNQKMFQKMKRQKYQALQKEKSINLFEAKNKQKIEQKIQESINNSEIVLQQDISKKDEKNIKKQPLILTIEVDEEHNEYLTINEGECYKQAAAKFIKDHKLGPQMYDKLIAGVERALKFQLTQIDQDSFESGYQSME